MKEHRLYHILLFLTVFVLGYGLWQFFETEEIGEVEVADFEQGKLYPLIRMGYARGTFYSPSIEIKQDVAFYYHTDEDLKVNQVGLEGVWLVERDRMVSLGNSSRLSVNIDSERLSIQLSGSSSLPIRYEVNGKAAGSFNVDGNQDYDLDGVSGIYFPKVVTLFIPRGIAVYNLQPK